MKRTALVVGATRRALSSFKPTLSFHVEHVGHQSLDRTFNEVVFSRESARKMMEQIDFELRPAK